MFIRRSYRSRGNEVRTNTNKLATRIVFSVRVNGQNHELDINIITVIIDMNKMFKYSAIKINANSGPPYSVLNPDTNSLSPSARS